MASWGANRPPRSRADGGRHRERSGVVPLGTDGYESHAVAEARDTLPFERRRELQSFPASPATRCAANTLIGKVSNAYPRDLVLVVFGSYPSEDADFILGCAPLGYPGGAE